MNSNGYIVDYEYEFYTTDYLENNKSEPIYINALNGGEYWDLVDKGYLYYKDISGLFESAPAGLSTDEIYNEGSVAKLCRVNTRKGSIEEDKTPGKYKNELPERLQELYNAENKQQAAICNPWG